MNDGPPVKIGDRVMVVGKIDDPDPVPRGTQGTVDWVGSWDSEATKQIGVKWDNGSKLMLLPTDPFVKELSL